MAAPTIDLQKVYSHQAGRSWVQCRKALVDIFNDPGLTSLHLNFSILKRTLNTAADCAREYTGKQNSELNAARERNGLTHGVILFPLSICRFVRCKLRRPKYYTAYEWGYPTRVETQQPVTSIDLPDHAQERTFADKLALGLNFGLNCVERVPYYRVGRPKEHTADACAEQLDLPIAMLFAMSHLKF